MQGLGLKEIWKIICLEAVQPHPQKGAIKLFFFFLLTVDLKSFRS